MSHNITFTTLAYDKRRLALDMQFNMFVSLFRFELFFIRSVFPVIDYSLFSEITRISIGSSVWKLSVCDSCYF